MAGMDEKIRRKPVSEIDWPLVSSTVRCIADADTMNKLLSIAERLRADKWVSEAERELLRPIYQARKDGLEEHDLEYDD